MASDQRELPALMIRLGKMSSEDSRYSSWLIAAMWQDGTVVRVGSRNSLGEQLYASGRVSREALSGLLDVVKEANPVAEAGRIWSVNGGPVTLLMSPLDESTRRLLCHQLPLPVQEKARWSAARQQACVSTGKPDQVSCFIDTVTRELMAIELTDCEEFKKVDWDKHSRLWPKKPRV